MKTIIFGRYDLQDAAEDAARKLRRSGFPASEMSLFYVSPKGQHATFPVGGDEDESEGTHNANAGAVRGAAGGAGTGALVGVAAIPVLGPAGPLLGAAVGAYTGSLVGALNTMEEGEQALKPDPETGVPAIELHTHKSGVILAVNIETPEQRETAIEILGERAEEVAGSEGTVQDGDWVDFNPLAPREAIR